MITPYDIILLKSHFRMDAYIYMIKKKWDKTMGRSMHALWQAINMFMSGSMLVSSMLSEGCCLNL